jgi:serine/threonine protein kinase
MPDVEVRIPGYEIYESLGEGPWGESFRARQTRLDRIVQLTLLVPEEEAKGPAIHARARICARLTHPHLVSGIDFGDCSSGKYLVTEWLDGPSVGQIVERSGGIAGPRSVEIALAAARGLEHASEQGLVHGAVTPEALVIARGGNPKLRGYGPDRSATRSDRDWRSPERKRGGRATARSDVYSLGLVLHHVLSGQYPFEDAPPAQVVGNHVVEVPVPLAKVCPKLGAGIPELVDWMLAPDPTDRFDTPADLVVALEELSERVEQRVKIRSTRTSRRTRGLRPRRRRRR